MNSIHIIVILGAILAGFAQGISGFAFGLIALSIWAWVLDPHIAAMLSICGALTGQLIAAFTVRRGFYFKQLLPFVIGGLIGIPIGTWLLPMINVDVFKASLGTLLVIWCPIMLLSSRMPQIPNASPVADGFFGMIGGMLSAMGGLAGAVPSLWSTFRGFERHVQRAVIQNFNLSVLLVTFLSYLISGGITAEVAPLLAITTPLVIISSLVGARLYKGMSDVRFKQIILSLLSIAGVLLLISSVPVLLRS